VKAVFLAGGFWQSMDTSRDKHVLEAHWASEQAPWKIWSDDPDPNVAVWRRTA